MAKGSIGTQTNTITKLKKVSKIECECNICINFRKNVCHLGRSLYHMHCKWFTAKPGTSIKSYRKRQDKVKNKTRG